MSDDLLRRAAAAWSPPTAAERTPPVKSAADTITELAAAGAQWVDLCAELGAVADRIARLDALVSAGLTRAGEPRYWRPVRQAAADVLHAACSPLRPYVEFVTKEAGREAAKRLRGS